MGVHGLWRLIEPSGKPVPLETLENKVLAVDISIWLHQAVKGFQDSKGAPVPNAHLLGIYHRVCKLLYFKIKPVFVFDGGVPALKRETIAKRNQFKARNSSEADRLQKQLLSALLQHSAISKVLSEKTRASITAQAKKTTKNENLFVLPISEEIDSTISSSEDEEETEESLSDSPTKQWDLHTIDPNSAQFKSLPLEVRHEILTELKDTRKQSSWGRIHELPKKSNDFATYQMNRLLKRQAVQSALDEAAQEMGGSSLSLAELESLLKDKGIPTGLNENVGKRIASDENTRYLYIKDLKEALAKAKLEEEKKEESSGVDDKPKSKADLEEEEELQRAIALSLQEVPSTSNSDNQKEMEISYLENFQDEDFISDESDEDIEVPKIPARKQFSSAESYMIEYSGLPLNAINKILEEKGKQPLKKTGYGQIKKTCKLENKHSNLCEQSKIVDESEFSVTSSNEENKVNSEKENVIEGNEINLSDSESKKDQSETETDKTLNTVKEVEKSNAILKPSIAEKKNEDDAEMIEVMSDSGDSSASEDFIEITSTSHVDGPKEESSLQLTIKPKCVDEDDIFSDIFENKKDVAKLDAILLGLEKPKRESEEKTVISDQNQDKLEVKDKEKSNECIKVNGTVGKELNNTDCTVIELRNKEKENGLKNNTVTENQISDSTDNLIKEPAAPELSIEEMQRMKNQLLEEKTDLLIEKSIKERMAVNITDQMYKEAQELLELFGVPYIIAPMEAEAQCAFLDEIELTDGTITDDSDIWLFGGQKVYKNFFNQSKFVLEFQAENIKHHFKLTREQMILLALLVGSDYTIGIHGVGPVTALEILAAFPSIQSSEIALSYQQLVAGLKEFKSWFHKGQTGGIGRSNLKSKLKNITFTDNFPSIHVVQAYLEPKVDPSREKFSWDKPDIVGLSVFAKEKFGWTSKKTDEILNPVIKRLEESHSQKSIKDYFKTKFKLDSGQVEGKVSKRVKTAIGRMGKTEEELIAEEMETLEKEKQKTMKEKKGSRRQSEKESKQKTSEEVNCETTDQEDNGKRVKGKKVASKKKVEPKEKKANEEPKEKRPKKDDASTKKASSNETESADEKQISQSDDFQSTKPRARETKRKSADNQEKPKPKVKKREDITNKIETISTSNSSEELKLYENVAVELKMRRQRQNQLAKMKQEELKMQKQKKEIHKKLETIPEELKGDEEVQFLLATTSASNQRTEEIHKEVQKEIDKQKQKKHLPNLHTKEVIHQRVRDKSDLLKNKIKAIEVFRKSKKGPGYVPKRQKLKRAVKDDAGLSEDSE